MKNLKLVWCAVIFSMVGFLLGAMFGFYEAINIISAKAAKFINVNQTLIQEYLLQAGVK